jgi:hypothetical protein
VAWRTCFLALVVLATAGHARPVEPRVTLECVDGSDETIRVAVLNGVESIHPDNPELRCDRDSEVDHRCRYAVTAPTNSGKRLRTRRGQLKLGRIRTLGIRNPIAISCVADRTKPPRTYFCVDGEERSGDVPCDLDGACQGSCAFGFRCPLCCACGAPCTETFSWWEVVGAGDSVAVPSCDGGSAAPAFILSCAPAPAGAVCISTTTTLPPLPPPPDWCESAADCSDNAPCTKCFRNQCVASVRRKHGKVWQVVSCGYVVPSDRNSAPR